MSHDFRYCQRKADEKNSVLKTRIMIRYQKNTYNLQKYIRPIYSGGFEISTKDFFNFVHLDCSKSCHRN